MKYKLTFGIRFSPVFVNTIDSSNVASSLKTKNILSLVLNELTNSAPLILVIHFFIYLLSESPYFTKKNYYEATQRCLH